MQRNGYLDEGREVSRQAAGDYHCAVRVGYYCDRYADGVQDFDVKS